MGLTLAEAGIFVLGAALIVRFLLRAALPQARTRFVSARTVIPATLREEFVLLPPTRIAAALLASAAVLAGAALAATRSVAVAAASGVAPVLFAGLRSDGTAAGGNGPSSPSCRRCSTCRPGT